ncbi:uncharacterized protein LOC123692335 [Colias croceus]|uniref:uncharacterized protein LOC123692335 n=1 Tax=Colias crocea TaxID=72248 RepID=UPI001E27A54F|nr:uncharacterized protein LOC123692335 [Colias croceus]
MNKFGLDYNEDSSKKGIITSIELLAPSEDELTLSSESSHRKPPQKCKHELHILRKEKDKEHHLTIQKLCSHKNLFQKSVKNNLKMHKENNVEFSNLLDDSSSKNFRNICGKRSFSDFKISQSVENFNSSFSSLKDSTFKTNFSFFFPKEKLKKPVNRQRSSSEIIKEITENLLTLELEKAKKQTDQISKLGAEKRNDKFQKQVQKSDLAKIILQPNIRDSLKKVLHKPKEKHNGTSICAKDPLDARKNESEIQKRDKKLKKMDQTSKEKEQHTQIKNKEVELQSETQEKDDLGSETPNAAKDTEQKDKDFGLDIIKAKEKDMKFRMKNKEKEKSKNYNTQVQPATTELSISKVKLRKPSTDDLVLQLVKIKHSEGEHRIIPRRWSELNISPLIIKRHQGHKLHQCMPGTRCLFCEDSELELDIDNILYNEGKKEELGDVIIGTKIQKNLIPKKKICKEIDVYEPLIFNTKYEQIQEDNYVNENMKSTEPLKKQVRRC